MPTTTFIAYDFEIGGTLPQNLEGAVRKSSTEYPIRWPGDPTGQSQGAIWNTIVRPGIAAADRLLAFVDLPNANVGFEVGYGLGLGKAVGLARVREALPAWVQAPPLHGFLCPRLMTPQSIRTQVTTPADQWNQLTDTPTRGPGVLLLCPTVTGASFLDELPEEWGWKTPPQSGWDLHTLPELLEGVGLVVWVLTPHDDGAAGRDGPENAQLAVVAGYVEARPGIELTVLKAKGARVVVDVVATQTPFGTVHEFTQQLQRIKADWDAKNAPPPPAGPDAPAGPTRPTIEPLPEDYWSDVPARFLGRQLQLGDAADAVEGVLHRARTGLAPTGGRAVKVIWVHGFGGMGKSWFLHRARIQAGSVVNSVVVDWDSSLWRMPLKSEPRCAQDIFDVIAYRLAQSADPAAADPYWAARNRVHASGNRYAQLRGRFGEQLSLAIAPDRSGPGMMRLDPDFRQLLQGEGLWDEDADKRAKRLDLLSQDAHRYQTVFAAWCHQTARDADQAAIEPDTVLADGLRESIRQTAARTPLLLLLDTGEVLSADLDRWLRVFLAPLGRDETPVLVLIGSRLMPDVAIPPGSREGWQQDLPRDRFRPVPFDEGVRFSVEEIEAALDTLSRPFAGDTATAAAQLHRITRGVPLAVRAVLDLHNDGEAESVLRELAETDDDEPLEEGAAVRNVVGTVAQRMLYHLDPQRRPERADDLRDIIALALLQKADETILKPFWRGQRVRDRLRDLGSRYALLSGGDLHATVRSFLRRHWRDEDERPRMFDEVLADVEKVVAELPTVPVLDGSAESLGRRLLELNLRSWREGDGVVPELAGLLAVAMAYEVGVEETQGLFQDLPLGGPTMVEARKLWKTVKGRVPEEGAVIGWLHQTGEAASGWSDLERACVTLLRGVSLASWDMKATEALSVFAMLEAAFGHFGAEHLPQCPRVGQAIFDAAQTLHPHKSNEKTWCSQTETAYRRAITLGANVAASLNNLGLLHADHLSRYTDAEQEYLAAIGLEPIAIRHNNLGNLYQDYLGRYEDAEREYLAAIQLDPKDATPHHQLGNLYQDHLGRYEDAEREYLAANNLEPDAITHNNLGNLDRDHLGRYEDAEREYLAAIQLGPKYANPHNGLGNLYRDHLGRYADAEREYLTAIQLDPKYARPHHGLADLYQDHLGRYVDAGREYLAAIQLDLKIGSGHRGLAWLCLLHFADVARARPYAEEAMAIDSKHPGSPFATMAVTMWQTHWSDARAQMPEWLATCPGWFVSASRPRLAAFVRKVREQGALADLAAMFRAVADRPHWQPWSEAVEAVVAGAAPTAWTSPEAERIFTALTEPPKVASVDRTPSER